LSRTKIPITLCKSVYLPELEVWNLVVASPWYDTKGPLKTFGAVIDALERAGIYKKVPIGRLRVTTPDNPLAKALQPRAREPRDGFVHILKQSRPKNGDQYSLIFAPIAGPGGVLPARRFSTLDDLKLFLAHDLHLRSSSIEDAVEEMKRTGASSVHPVSLGIRTAKKLGLA
ncbi:MAG TPA: hypothetical protein VK724_00110, partial [Bryobacteraceae bacterium]|nr:hypothetical protein [Bryobacteraceae bacterium]